MKKLTMHCLAVALLLALWDGCASPEEVSGPPLPVAGVGVVRSQLPVLLVSVDGKPGPGRLSGYWGSMLHFYGNVNKPYAPVDVSLEPGAHTLEFVYLGGREHSEKTVPEKLTVEAGGIYKVEALVEGERVTFAFHRFDITP